MIFQKNEFEEGELLNLFLMSNLLVRCEAPIYLTHVAMILALTARIAIYNLHGLIFLCKTRSVWLYGSSGFSARPRYSFSDWLLDSLDSNRIE